MKILVCGAGMAGLAAAYELTQAGHDVTVVEATAGPGGRVKTMRQGLAAGLHAEAGAIKIPRRDDLTNRYVQQFGLRLVPFVQSNLAKSYFVRGQRLPMGAQGIEWPDWLPESERRAGLAGMIKNYLDPLLPPGSRDVPCWSKDAVRRFDPLSYRELLIQQGASEAAVELLTLGFNLADGTDELSSMMILRLANPQHNAPEACCIEGGNDGLPQAFARRLPGQILYGAPIQAIRQDEDGVSVHFSRGGARERIDADALICAIPFTALREVDVDPPFSVAKQAVIRDLGYSPLSRVFLQCRDRFWVAKGLSGFADTDLPICTLADVSVPQSDKGILMAYCGGAEARLLEGMSESERRERTLSQVEKVFPEVRTYCETSISYCWGSDRWIQGGVACTRPGQGLEFEPHIASREGRVVFAGEHTSLWQGGIHGALASGLRAAAELMASVPQGELRQ